MDERQSSKHSDWDFKHDELMIDDGNEAKISSLSEDVLSSEASTSNQPTQEQVEGSNHCESSEENSRKTILYPKSKNTIYKSYGFVAKMAKGSDGKPRLVAECEKCKTNLVGTHQTRMKKHQ